MTTAIDAHILDLENEAREADRDVDELRDRHEHLIESMNLEVSNLVAKIQAEKARLKEDLNRLKNIARRKHEEVDKFRGTLLNGNGSTASVPPSTYQASSRPSAARTSNTSVDDIREGAFTPVNANSSDFVDPPKSLVKKSLPPPTSEPSFKQVTQKYLPNMPIIVKSPADKWLEIRCMLCQGNYIDKKGWIRGARGMLAHANKSHKIDTFGGKKLDSTNILEFCTHREMTDEEVEDVLEGRTKLEVIACRDVTNANQQFAASTPKVTKTDSTPNGKGAEVDESDLPYDWLLRYPTIVLRRDGVWVELRCDICGGNSLANSDKRYAQGVIGFVRHLSRGHGIKPDRPNSRLDWAMTRCTFREVPAEEIAALTENLDTAPAPLEKVPFRQSVNGGRDSLGSNVEFTPPVKRPRTNKRASELLDPSDDEETDLDADLADSDFNPNDRDPEAKRARSSLVTSSPKQPLRATKRAKSSHSVPASPASATPGAAKADSLDKYCPCSVGGHDCMTENCSRIHICTQSQHDDACRNSNSSHDLKPTCVMAVLGTECPDGESCSRGHDFLDERRHIAQTHDCKAH